MDIDFHYYGTYVAALYAGYSKAEAQTIAHAAQYVDDSTHARLIKEGEYDMDLKPIPTCHTFSELGWTTLKRGPSLSELHQVWVPFHFLPGNYKSNTLPDPNASSRMKTYKGPTQDSFLFGSWEYDAKAQWEFKLLCLPKSPIAIAMINDIIDNHKGEPYELHLIGLRMHVFADSVAHAYYAGTPAWHINDVKGAVYDCTVDPKKKVPFGPLPGQEKSTPNTTNYYDSIFYHGHGRMGHIPDYPWIKHEYSPKWASEPIIKDNPVEYLKVFRQMVTALKHIKDREEVDVDSFDPNNLVPINQNYLNVLDQILGASHEFGRADAPTFRCECWMNKIKDKGLGEMVLLPEAYDVNKWLNYVKQKGSVTGTDYYKFQRAAQIHLEYVREKLFADGIKFNWGEIPVYQLAVGQASGQTDYGRLDVFACGMRNVLWHKWQTVPNDGWSGWASLGGWIDQLAIGQNGDGRWEIFARGKDKALWHRWQTVPNKNSWSDWESFGGWIDQLAVGQTDFGRLEVFARGANKDLWHRYQTAPYGSNWSAWESLGGIIDKPVVALNKDGRLEVFVIGSDTALWHRWQTETIMNRWSDWESLDGGIDLLAVGRNWDGRLEVFARGANKDLWHRYQTAPNGSNWSAWESLGGWIDQLAVGQNLNGRLEVFVRGEDRVLLHRWQTEPNENSWSAWESLGGKIDKPVVARNKDGHLEVFVLGPDHTVWHIWQTKPDKNSWSSWALL